MAEVASRDNGFLPHLYSKIEGLPSQMQEEVLLFTNFLLNKSMTQSHYEKNPDLDEIIDDNRFSNLSLLSLSKEWDTAEDEDWDTILAQMSSIG